MTVFRCLVFATAIGLLLRWTPAALAIDRSWDDGSASDLWISAANWNPNGVPESVDTVAIGNMLAAVDDTVLFAAFGSPLTDTITGLTITLGADLDTREGRLVIVEDTFVGGTSVVVTPETKSELIVSPYGGGDAIDTNTLTVLDNGQLTMTGGSVSVDGTGNVDGVLEIQEGGSIYGYGVIDLDDNNISDFTDMLLNDGSITVGDPEAIVLGEPPARTLQINAPNDPQMGLMDINGDSDDGRVVILRNSTLELNVRQINQSSAGDITMYGNSTLDLGVTFGVGNAAPGDTASLLVNSGETAGFPVLPAAPAVISGNGFLLTVRGRIWLSQPDAELQMESGFTALSGSIINNGTIHFAGDAWIEPEVTFSGAGEIVNDVGSTLHLRDGVDADTGLVNDGTLTIHSSLAGNVRVDSIEQSTSGMIGIQIANILPGDFDMLTVDGNANVGGTLAVELINGFEPVLGNSFTILETVFGNVSGQFDVEIVPEFNDLTFNVIYNPQSVVLQVVAAGLPGDYNDDGTVDAVDYVVWRDNESSNNPLRNDPIGGEIGDAQYNQWRANFGNTAASGAAISGTHSAQASVPEPAPFVLMISGFVAACCVARRGVANYLGGFLQRPMYWGERHSSSKRMARISKRFMPRGTSTSTRSPTFLPINPCASGLATLILPVS